MLELIEAFLQQESSRSGERTPVGAHRKARCDSTHAIANFEFERVVSYQRTWNNS